MTYKEGIEWCEQHLAVVWFDPSAFLLSFKIVTEKGYKDINIFEGPFLYAVKKAMKVEEEECS